MVDCSGWFEEKERRGLIDGPSGRLEIVTTAATERGALAAAGLVAVVCHPHPQHGGTMDNKVVTTLVRTYRDLGVPVVRFNFRGVGASEGEYDAGTGEADDLLAVVAWLQQCLPGRQLLLAGFSFGSAVAARAAHILSSSLRHLVLVAPPVERYVYEEDKTFPCPLLVVIGEQDELVDVAGVHSWQQSLHSDSALISYPEASHFFHGALGQLKNDLSSALKSELAQ